ncbi:MAG: transcriptional regulator [Propionibacteriales bacterium]|nr:transcriptional regulator [Propionibacteriales bacterium]
MTSAPSASAPTLLVLHALRLAGTANEAQVAGRTGLGLADVSTLLLDFAAYGWASKVSFSDVDAWALTARGHDRDDHLLAAELQTVDRATLADGHRAFEELNPALVKACTDWQLRPRRGDRFASNDHRDRRWDRRILGELVTIGEGLVPIAVQLRSVLTRFDGYDRRFAAALERADSGEHQWVAGVEVPSCHAVWMELHEDLLSTLAIPRSAEIGKSR